MSTSINICTLLIARQSELMNAIYILHLLQNQNRLVDITISNFFKYTLIWIDRNCLKEDIQSVSRALCSRVYEEAPWLLEPLSAIYEQYLVNSI